MIKHGWKCAALILLAALVCVWLAKASILSAYLSDKLHVSISIGWAGLWPGRLNMRSFIMKNPQGFTHSAAFEAQGVECRYQLASLLANPLEIDRIAIRNAQIYIDCSDLFCGQNNWKAIGAKLPRDKKERGVIIHKLVITDLRVIIHGLGMAGEDRTKFFDRMEFDKIDSRNGFPTAELVRKMFENAGIDQWIEDFFNPGKDLERFLNPLMP